MNIIIHGQQNLLWSLQVINDQYLEHSLKLRSHTSFKLDIFLQMIFLITLSKQDLVFLGSSVSKEFACNAGDPSLIPGSGRSPGEGIGYPLHYSCMENPMDRGAQRATLHAIAKNGTRLSDQAQHSSTNKVHLQRTNH